MTIGTNMCVQFIELITVQIQIYLRCNRGVVPVIWAFSLYYSVRTHPISCRPRCPDITNACPNVFTRMLADHMIRLIYLIILDFGSRHSRQQSSNFRFCCRPISREKQEYCTISTGCSGFWKFLSPRRPKIIR